MINFIKKNILILIYSLIELVICILLLTKLIDKVNILRYSLIIINFIASIVILAFSRSKRSIYFCISFFFICLADYGLIILGDNYELSVTYFLFAQLALMIMMKINKLELLIRLSLVIVLEVVAVLICKDLYSILVFVTMIYLSTFISNITFGIIKKENIVFIIGMILFIMCDTCVGIANFELFTNEKLVEICEKLIFIFYIPGLYLMVIGTYINEIIRGVVCKKEKNI